MKTHIGLGVNVEFISYNKKTGKINKKSRFHNLVVDDGLDSVATLIASEFTHVAIGTGTTSATSTDSELETEFTREAVSATSGGNGIRVYDHEFTVGSGVSQEITEAGLFNSATPSGSTMLNRAVTTPAFTLDNDNPLRVVITITVSTS